MGRHCFEYKLPGQHKLWTWYVCPSSKADGFITVQTDGMCGEFSADTGAGYINRKCEYTGVALCGTRRDENGKRQFLHTDTKEYQWPMDFVELAKTKIPQSGDIIGSSPITGVVRVA